MPTPITNPAGYVVPVALSFADASGAAALVASANPLPVSFSTGLGEIEVRNDIGNPLAISGSVTPIWSASGKAAVAGAVAAGAQSGIFSPLPCRDFNVTIAGSGAAQLERQFAGDTSWYVVLPDAQRQILPPSFAFGEAEAGVGYRVNVVSGGPFQVRLSQ